MICQLKELFKSNAAKSNRNDFFFNFQSNPPHVSLSEMSLWFGEIEWSNEKRTVHQVTVQLSNHTYGKVTAHWVEGS